MIRKQISQDRKMTRRVDDTKSRGGNKERILLLSPHVSNLRVSRGRQQVPAALPSATTS